MNRKQEIKDYLSKFLYKDLERRKIETEGIITLGSNDILLIIQAELCSSEATEEEKTLLSKISEIDSILKLIREDQLDVIEQMLIDNCSQYLNLPQQ